MRSSVKYLNDNELEKVTGGISWYRLGQATGRAVTWALTLSSLFR